MTTATATTRRDAAQQPQGRDCTNPRGSHRKAAVLHRARGARRHARETRKTMSQTGKPAVPARRLPARQTSAASVSRVVSTTSSPARRPGFTDGFGNTMRSSSCRTV